MATVITTQPTNSAIKDLEDVSIQQNLISKNAENGLDKSNANIKEDANLLRADVENDGMVQINSLENEDVKSRLREEEEKRKSQQQIDDCCCVCYDSADEDPCLLYYCISSCFRSLVICTDNSFNGCSNCIANCCDSNNAVVDDQTADGCCDCDGCDCGDCDCSGCDCNGCDCSGCDCGDCAECCLCLGSLLECCKD